MIVDEVEPSALVIDWDVIDLHAAHLDDEDRAAADYDALLEWLDTEHGLTGRACEAVELGEYGYLLHCYALDLDDGLPILTPSGHVRYHEFHAAGRDGRHGPPAALEPYARTAAQHLAR